MVGHGCRTRLCSRAETNTDLAVTPAVEAEAMPTKRKTPKTGLANGSCGCVCKKERWAEKEPSIKWILCHGQHGLRQIWKPKAEHGSRVAGQIWALWPDQSSRKNGNGSSRPAMQKTNEVLFAEKCCWEMFQIFESPA